MLFGGDSSEREISLLTGNAVLAALQRRGVDAHALRPARRARCSELLTRRASTRVWIALHGPGGEDGTLQGALEYLGIPYTGSGVHGLGDRHGQAAHQAPGAGRRRADRRLRGAARGPQDFDAALERLELPLIVKPATQGSSVGMTQGRARARTCAAAYAAAAQFEPLVFAEPWITGAEYTVAILQGAALPSIRIETPTDLLRLRGQVLPRRHALLLSLRACRRARRRTSRTWRSPPSRRPGAAGWGRVDFMMDATGRPLLLEINTIPGMTDHSLVPMAARAAGIDFEELCWRVLETSFTRAPANCQGDA